MPNNPNFNYAGLPNYGYPNKQDKIGLLIGSLLGAGLGAAGGQNTGDALLRGAAGGMYSYGAGLNNIQDYNTQALNQQRIADHLLYQPEQQQMERENFQMQKDIFPLKKQHEQAWIDNLLAKSSPEDIEYGNTKRQLDINEQRLKNRKTGKEIRLMGQPSPKEFNTPGDLDTFLASKAGRFDLDYSNPEHRAKMLSLFGQQDTGLSRQYNKWKPSLAPNIYNVVPGYQTPEGQPLTFNARKGIPKESSPMQKTPSEADVKFERDYTTADALLDELEKGFIDNEDKLPNNAWERVMEYPSRQMGKVLQTESGQSLKNLEGLRTAIMPKMIRALGEVGTLTDADIQRVNQAVSSINDVKPVREKGIKQLRDLIGEVHTRGQRQQNIIPNANKDKIQKPSLDEIFKGK